MSEQEPPKGSTLVAYAMYAIIGGLVYGGIAIYHAINDAGWIPHTQTVDLYMKGDWLNSENRQCVAIQSIPERGKEPTIDALFCPEEAEATNGHNISITCWGKISRPDVLRGRPEDMRNTHWRCTRGEEHFTCYALD